MKPLTLALGLALALSSTACREKTPPAAADAAASHVGSVKLGPLRVIGSLSPDIVYRGVEQGLERLRGCYDKGLAAQPGAAGVVFVQFTLEPTGKVTHARTFDSTAKAPVLEACLAETFSTFQYAPTGKEPIEVTCPLLFSTK